MNFNYQPLFQLSTDDTEYEFLGDEGISSEKIADKEILKIGPEVLTFLAENALHDVSFFLRKAHLERVAKILADPEASANDCFVAETLLKNAVVAANEVLPSCQDTGTAIVIGKKGELVWTEGDDRETLSKGIFNTYQKDHLRYSQMAPQSMTVEKNTQNNLPAQIDIYSEKGNEYHFLFLAKGGGSANKTYLFQKTRSLLNEKSLESFFKEKLFALGTAACPPYYISFVIGGTSAEANLKTVKLASTGYYDYLPSSGDDIGRAYRDLVWEKRIQKMAEETKIGAQFGGKYLAHEIKVIRLPRHAASCPVGLGVSCSADRNIKGKITTKGIFLEKLEKNPQRLLEKYTSTSSNISSKTASIELDLEQSMEKILQELDKHSVGTRLNLRGSLIVARDIAHAKIKEMLDKGEKMPEYFKNHPIYYAGPAKKPVGMPSGSFGPTTASRMDVYVDEFQKQKASLIMLAKGNRDEMVTQACKKNGGFYLGSIGGPAAILASESIKSVEIVDFEELGMEAVRKIKVENFPSFIICDNKGNNLFR